MEKILAAAQEIALHIRDRYTSSQGVHAETVIGAAAAITGEWSLWACGLPIPDDSWVVIPATNALLVEGDRAASRLIAAAVRQSGGDDKKLPDGPTLLARTAAAFGKTFPPLTVDKAHFPQEWSPLAAPRFRSDIRRIGEKHGLRDSKEIFGACGLATSLLISATAKVLDPTIAGTLALEIMVAVSRMAPARTEKFLKEQGAAP
jgi:hypothetical protein